MFCEKDIVKSTEAVYYLTVGRMAGFHFRMKGGVTPHSLEQRTLSVISGKWRLQSPLGKAPESRSQIHERTISFRCLGIILRVLRPEVSVYNVYITDQFQTPFARGGGGG